MLHARESSNSVSRPTSVQMKYLSSNMDIEEDYFELRWVHAHHAPALGAGQSTCRSGSRQRWKFLTSVARNTVSLLTIQWRRRF